MATSRRRVAPERSQARPQGPEREPDDDIVWGDFARTDTRRRGEQSPDRWTLWDALKTFSLRNLVFALILGLLAGAAGALIAHKKTPLYASSVTLVIDQPAFMADARDEGVIRKLNLLKLKYGDLIGTPVIAGIAARQLGVPEGQVAVAVHAGAPPTESLVLAATAQAGTTGEAIRIANAIGDAIVVYADQDQASQSIPAAARYRFTVVAPASGAAQIQPTTKRAVQAAFGLGVAGFLLAYVVLQLLTAEKRIT